VCTDTDTNADGHESAAPTTDEDPLRSLALKRVERVRNFRLHLALFAAGTFILSGLWALTEYMEADGWPAGFGDEDTPGTWDIWIFFVVGAWALFVVLKGVGTYFGRPPSEADVERELERLKSGG
jgi:2TM domain